jgi:hypothetical protein
MKLANQQRWGEGNPNAKLTVDDVAEIREMLAHESTYVIARRFKVAQSTIMRIKNGTSWPPTNRT